MRCGGNTGVQFWARPLGAEAKQSGPVTVEIRTEVQAGDQVGGHTVGHLSLHNLGLRAQRCVSSWRHGIFQTVSQGEGAAVGGVGRKVTPARGVNPFSLGFFLEFCSILSSGACFFASSFWQPPCGSFLCVT